MQKRTLFAAGIVVLCAAGGVGYYQFNRAHEGTGDIAPEITTGAPALYADYQADEKTADGKYLGKVVLVRGRVVEISRADTAASIVLGNGGGGGVNCSFGSGMTDKLNNLHTGDSVSCKGRCTGFLMDVNLSDCVLEP